MFGLSKVEAYKRDKEIQKTREAYNERGYRYWEVIDDLAYIGTVWKDDVYDKKIVERVTVNVGKDKVYVIIVTPNYGYSVNSYRTRDYRVFETDPEFKYIHQDNTLRQGVYRTLGASKAGIEACKSNLIRFLQSMNEGKEVTICQ